MVTGADGVHSWRFSLSTQFSSLWWVWAFDGLPGIGRNRFLMQLSLKYEILDTRQEATSLATILLGPRYPTSSALQSHIGNFLEKLTSSFL